MILLTPTAFDAIIKNSSTIKNRFKKDLRFTTSVEDLTDEGWAMREVVAIYDKNKNTGVLLLQPYEVLYVVAFESGNDIKDSMSGRSKAIICDFCYTWRAGGDAGLVTFYPSTSTATSTAQLCCRDLECSQHVRTTTKAAIMSRAQLREHIGDNERVERLKRNLQLFIDKLRLEPVVIGDY